MMVMRWLKRLVLLVQAKTNLFDSYRHISLPWKIQYNMNLLNVFAFLLHFHKAQTAHCLLAVLHGFTKF